MYSQNFYSFFSNRLIDATNLFTKFLNESSKEKSYNDYISRIDGYKTQVNSTELDIYINLLKITDKHLLIPFGSLPTCACDIWASAFMPYFEQSGVNYEKLIELGFYVIKKQEELDKIRDEIICMLNCNLPK